MSLLACEGDFGVTLESLFTYDDDFVATLGSLCGYFSHLGRLWGHFGITLGLLWEHLRHVGATLGSLWGHFVVRFGSVWGQVGVRFGSVWGEFGYRWVALGHLMVTLQSLWIHSGYMKVIFQKTHIFHTYLNDFIKLFGGLWVDLGLIWDRFWHMKVYLGPLWGHFGGTLGI